MMYSERTLKWVMRFYPPLFFQRIWVQRFGKDFKSVEVKINKSFLNINYHGSIFGGSIFSATDPFHAILFDQILKHKGFKVRVWLKSGEIKYLKPGRSALYFKIHISDADLSEAETALRTAGKFIKSFPIEIYNAEGEICVSVRNEVYIRNLHPIENQTPSF